MFEGFVDIGFGDKLLIVPVLLVVLTLIGISRKLSSNIQLLSLYLMTATFMMLGFMHFHPQWFIWMMPFVAIYMSDKIDWTWFSIMLVALFGIIILFDDKYLYWGLLSPINNGLVNLPYISEMLANNGVSVKLLNNLCHSIIAAVGIYWLNVCARDEQKI
jgi:hypothetical protein